MWQFSQAIDGITKACEELEIPITGGNVSFYNETLGEGIYPTPVMGVVGILEDVHKAAKMHFGEAGRTIVLLRAASRAMPRTPKRNLARPSMRRKFWERSGVSAELELEKEAALQKALVELIRQELVDSAHDCSEGGIAVALAETAFPKGVGARESDVSDGLSVAFRCLARTPAGS